MFRVGTTVSIHCPLLQAEREEFLAKIDQLEEASRRLAKEMDRQESQGEQERQVGG